jgi:hypothetical protein
MKYILPALLALSVACASVQNDPGDSRTMRDARQCLKAGPCIVMQVDNGNFADAVVYVNSGRIGFVSGMSKAQIYIPRVRLDASGCITVGVRLIAGATMTTSRECPLDNEYLRLDISPLFSTTNLSRVIVH